MASVIRTVLIGALLLYFAVTVYVFVVIPHTTGQHPGAQSPPSAGGGPAVPPSGVDQQVYSDLLREVQDLKRELKDLSDSHSKLGRTVQERGKEISVSSKTGVGVNVEDVAELARKKMMFATRDIPDSRLDYCKTVEYRDDYPPVAVIIVTHNEQDSLVLRTVKSVLDRTPEKFLKEIIVIDDASMPFLFSDVGVMPKTRVYRTYEQVGLIKARTIGVEKSTAEVLVFLDAHCEANVGWLEPMLHQVHKDYRYVAWPSIDYIDHTTYEYQPAQGDTGVHAFEVQNLRDIGTTIPEWAKEFRKNKWDPLPTPTFPGGLFAISRKFWDEWGGYDLDMSFYGTENTDMSVRIWVCGGMLLLTPCSHVGHVYRDQKAIPDYVMRTTLKNRIRFAEVWMDDYKYAMYKYFNIDKNQIEAAGDTSKMRGIKDKLQCKSFKWFHKNIYPNMEIPNEYFDNPDLDIWWPDPFSKSKVTTNKPNRAVVAYIGEASQRDGALWLLYSLRGAAPKSSVDNGENVDAYLFYKPSEKSAVPPECEMYDTKDDAISKIQPTTAHTNLRCFAIALEPPADSTRLNFPVLAEVFPMAEAAGFHPLLKKYEYIVKTDLQVIFTPQFATWFPPKDKYFQMGKGSYVFDDITKQNIYKVAKDLNLRNNQLHNLGYSWYGPAQKVLDVATLTYTTTIYILDNYFKENAGAWPSWFRGVAMKYATEIAVNHIVDNNNIQTDLLDGNSNSGRTCAIAQIRTWEGMDLFSKSAYDSGQYNDAAVDEDNMGYAKYYSRYVALKSTKKDKNKGDVPEKDKKKLIDLCMDTD